MLKGSAVCLTLVATVASTAYVGGHVKGQSAPLRPSLHPEVGQQAAAGGRGQVNLGPGVSTTSSQPVTETSFS